MSLIWFFNLFYSWIVSRNFFSFIGRPHTRSKKKPFFFNFPAFRKAFRCEFIGVFNSIQSKSLVEWKPLGLGKKFMISARPMTSDFLKMIFHVPFISQSWGIGKLINWFKRNQSRLNFWIWLEISTWRSTNSFNFRIYSSSADESLWQDAKSH